MRIRLAVLAALAATASTAQIPVQPTFELMLPDIGRVIPGGTNVVADVPLRQITRLIIQVLGSADANLSYGDLRVRINGKGTRNVFDSGSNERGKYLAMSAATLRMRRDEIFDRSENTIEVYGKDKRGREYYQNWILRVVDDKANPWFTWISSMSPLDETGVPPDLVLDQPSAPVLFTAAAKNMGIRLKGQASAASGISSVSINGNPVSVAQKSPTVTFDQNYALARGKTAISVETVDSKGNKRNVTIPVIYPGPSAPQPKFAGQTWAVVIGVSRFDAKEGAPPPLPQAAFDAKALASQLTARGVKPENLVVLTDEQATADKVRIALGDFVAKAKPEDLLLVYWSTQGLHDPASPDKVYLATADTQMLHLADTAIEISELQLLLERSVRSRHSVLFFDADHPLGREWDFQGRSIVSTHLLNLFDEQLGRSVLVSGTEDKAGRSTFSTALLAAFGGKADVDQNGVLTPHEICAYVTEEVRKATGGNQLPRALLAKQDEESSILALK